jgi:hypothetical protein
MAGDRKSVAVSIDSGKMISLFAGLAEHSQARMLACKKGAEVRVVLRLSISAGLT